MAETINLGIVGIKNMGEYDAETNYEKLNVVTYQGSTYCALQSTKGNLPTDTDYWQLYAQKGGIGPEGPQGPKPVKGVDYYTAEDRTSFSGEIANDVSTEVSEQLGSLTSATPLVASSTSEMTDTTRVYVNTTDGYWYYYDGSNWIQGGVYQASEDSQSVAQLQEDVIALNTNIKQVQEGNTNFSFYGVFENASLNRGVINRNNKYRVSTDTIMTFDRDLIIKVDNNFKYGVQYFVDGEFKRDSGWIYEEYIIPKGSSFKISIARTTENQSEVANIFEFVNKVTFKTDVQETIDELKDYDNLLNYSYPELLHEKNVRNNGGCMNSDGIYMWIVSTNKNIHYVNILTGEYDYVNASVNGITANNGGHCNDFAYNPNDECYYMATMLEDGSIAKLNSSYVYQTSIEPRGANNEIIVTEGICFDRKNNQYILAGENDWNFYVFDENWNYVRTITPTDTPGKTKQGIETDGMFIYRILTNSEYRAWIRTYLMDGTYIGEFEITHLKGGELESLAYDWEHNMFACAVNITVDGTGKTRIYNIIPNEMSYHAVGCLKFDLRKLSYKLNK